MYKSWKIHVFVFKDNSLLMSAFYDDEMVKKGMVH